MATNGGREDGVDGRAAPGPAAAAAMVASVPDRGGDRLSPRHGGCRGGCAVGVHHLAAHPALRHGAGVLPAARRHQDLRRQRRAHHRAARRAPYLRAPGPHPANAAGRRHRDRGQALLLSLGHRPHRHRAGDSPELPARPGGRGREHDHAAAHQAALLDPRQEPGAQAEGGRPRAGARAALHQGPHPGDVSQPGVLRPRRLRCGGGRPHVLRQIGIRAERAGGGAPGRPAPRADLVFAVRARRGRQAAARGRPAAPRGVRRSQGRGRQAAGSGRPGPDPPGAATHDRPVLPRLRPADARDEVRGRHGVQGRPRRLHDAQPYGAASRRAGPSRWPQGP